ncbi:hypothetical protein BC829DRAFT_378728 [Chytridium lagenaria]|nr:hypothetical protein BC829DRAFT_378728 [Chytridium lagenaria]
MINPRNAGPSSTRHARTGRNALPSSSPQAPETGFDNLVWETSTPQIPIPLSFQNSYGLETPPVGIMESGGRQWHLSTDTPRPRSAPPSNAGHLRGLANQMPPNPYVRMLQQPRRTSSTPSFRPTVDTSPYPNDAGQASTLSSTSSSALTNSHASSSSTTPSCIIPPSLIMDPIPKYNPPLQSVSVPPGLDTRLPGPLDPRNNTPSHTLRSIPLPSRACPRMTDPHTLKRQRPVSSSSIVSDIPSASFARRRGSTNSIDVEEEEDEDFVDEEDGGGGVASGATSGTSGTPKNDVGEKSKDEKDLIRRKRNTEAAKRSRERKNARISNVKNSNLRIRAAVLQNDKTALQMRERELITRVSVLETQLAEVHRSMHEVAMRYHALQQGMTSVGYEESGESGESGASQLRGNDGGDEVEEDIIEKDREFGKDENPN